MRDDLSEKDGIDMYNKMVIIPMSLKEDIMEILNAADKDCSSMETKAAKSVWWLGLKQR